MVKNGGNSMKEQKIKNIDNANAGKPYSSLCVRKTLSYFIKNIGEICINTDKINLDEINFEIFRPTKKVVEKNESTKISNVDHKKEEKQPIETQEVEKSPDIVNNSENANNEYHFIYYKNISQVSSKGNQNVLNLKQNRLPDINRNNKK